MLSIIVPVYNVEKYLNKCLDSLVAQTYKDIEIILVDDGSTDSSGNIIDTYAQKYDTIKVIHKTNGGPTSAYLKGLEECEGEYIGFVDSDDWVEPDMYEKMMPKFGIEGVNLVVCRYDKVFGEKSIPSNNILEDRMYDRKDIDSLFFDNPTNHAIVSLSRCNKIYIKSDLEKIIPYLDADISFVEDNAFNLLFATKVFNKGYMLGDILYHYRYNPNSNSTRISDKKLNDMGRVFEILKQSDTSGQYLRKFNGAYVVACFIALSAIIRSDVKNNEKVKRIKQILNHPDLLEAKNNCEWMCSNLAQRVKKFLIKHRMARTYLFVYKLIKL